MKLKSGLLCLLGIIALGSLNAADSTDPTTLTGQFIWNKQQDKPRELKAVFTPDGPQKWKAVYTFLNPVAKDQPVTYTGTVTGDLQNGQINGTSIAEGGKRTFELQGTAEKGVLTFTHSETTNHRVTPTGTGVLKVTEPAAKTL